MTVIGSIAVPCNTHQVTAGCNADRTFATLSPHLIDVGINYLAIISPINCAAVKSTTTITNASVRYYLMSTVQDVDANYNGLVDSTEVTSALGVTTGTAVDWDKGWTCNDMPTAWNWQPDLTNTWTYP